MMSELHTASGRPRSNRRSTTTSNGYSRARAQSARLSTASPNSGHLGRLAEKSLTVKLNRLVAEGDTVVAITEVTAGGETGEDADVFILRDGKTVRVETHGTRR